jgi:hypothetical protein
MPQTTSNSIPLVNQTVPGPAPVFFLWPAYLSGNFAGPLSRPVQKCGRQRRVLAAPQRAALSPPGAKRWAERQPRRIAPRPRRIASEPRRPEPKPGRLASEPGRLWPEPAWPASEPSGFVSEPGRPASEPSGFGCKPTWPGHGMAWLGAWSGGCGCSLTRFLAGTARARAISTTNSVQLHPLQGCVSRLMTDLPTNETPGDAPAWSL